MIYCAPVWIKVQEVNFGNRKKIKNAADYPINVEKKDRHKSFLDLKF